MKKGQRKRVWTKEQRLEIIGKHLNEHISVRTLEKEYNADRSMICYWLRDYGKYGEAAFNPKGHPGTPFAALHKSRTLTGNERLKKGYQAKGVGANKVFVSLKDVNTK